MPTKKYKAELKKQYMILGVSARSVSADDFEYSLYPEVEDAYYNYRASAKDHRFDSKKEALAHALKSDFWQGKTFMIQKVYTQEIDWTHPLN
jgi:pyruvate-formate lyase